MIKQYQQYDQEPNPNYFHFTGELRLRDTLTEIDYLLYNSSRFENYSISDFLSNLYKTSISPLKVIIKELESGEVNSNIGVLHIAKDSWGINSWYIDQFALEEELDKLVGAKLEIFIRRLDAVNVAENTEAVGNSNEQQKSKQIIA